MRAARSATFPDSGRRPPRGVRLHRRLVQPTPPPFRARLPVAHDFRAFARNRRSHSDLRIDDRPGGCYLSIPLGAGAVTISKAVHPPPNRVKSTSRRNQIGAETDTAPAMDTSPRPWSLER